MIRAVGIFLLLLVSCGPQSLSDVRREGRQKIQTLNEKLVSIRTRTDLLDERETLEKEFNSLADLMIKGWEYYSSNTSEEKRPLEEIDHTLSISLEAEMARLAQIDPDLLESCYKQAQTKLHIYLQKHQ